MRIGFERTDKVITLTPAIYWDWGSWSLGIVFLCFHLYLEYNRDTADEQKSNITEVDKQNRGGDATPEKKG